MMSGDRRDLIQEIGDPFATKSSKEAVVCGVFAGQGSCWRWVVMAVTVPTIQCRR